MRTNFSKILLIVILGLGLNQVNAQSIGFGCFGFVSGFGGYTYQSYTPGHLKDYGNELRQNQPGLLTDPYFDEFGELKGFRVGLNFFRAKFSGFFISTKGYYQFLSETKNIYVSSSYPDVEYDLDLKTWGLGIDFGIPVTTFLNWKILDGELMFNSAGFKRTINEQGNTSVIRYNNDSPEIGYSIGTGFIVSLIDGYISLEGTAGYTILRIEKMQDDEGNIFLSDAEFSTENNFINSGGFSAVVQVNVGFPL